MIMFVECPCFTEVAIKGTIKLHTVLCVSVFIECKSHKFVSQNFFYCTSLCINCHNSIKNCANFLGGPF